MNLRRLAFKNVWRSRGRYLAYLGSAAFSVAIYFLYAALTHHPALRGGFPGAEFVPEVANAAAFVIAVFTLLFLLYSGAAFVRYRMKEFGLLTLLGFSRGQLVRMILWENLVVAATALAVGLGAGLLFLKLFFMAISAVLHLPQELPLYAGTPVWTKTLAVFGAFFAVVSLLGLREVLRRSVIQLIQARRQPKESPRFSFLKAAAGLCLVVAGYAWASAPSPNAVIAGVVPVTVIVSIGTYLLFREGFIAALTGLRRREQLYMRPKPFLVVSQLLFKLQDNYRVLSAVSLLIAVILSAVGTIYSLYVVVAEDALNANPHPIQLTVGPGDPAASAVRAALERHGVSDLREVAATLLKASVDNKAMYVVANSVYRSLQRPQGEPAALAGPHEAIVVYPFGQRTPAPQVRAEAVLSVGGETLAVSIVPDLSGRLINGAIGLTPVAVVDDAVYAKLEGLPEVERLEIVAWTGASWRSRTLEAVLRELEQNSSVRGVLTATLSVYHATIATFGLVLFIGIFVSLVFFAATCSLLYFRLFTEVDDDRRYFQRLHQLGVDRPDIGRLSLAQNAVVFFVPFAVGAIHATFAMRALGTLYGQSVLGEGWLVAVAYLLVYTLYFAATNGVYQRAADARR